MGNPDGLAVYRAETASCNTVSNAKLPDSLAYAQTYRLVALGRGCDPRWPVPQRPDQEAG